MTALATDGGLLYSAGNDQTIRLWSCSSCAAVGIVAQNITVPSSLSIESEAGVLLSASHLGAGQISVWTLPTLLAGAAHAASVRESLSRACVAPMVAALGALLPALRATVRGDRNPVASKPTATDEAAARSAASSATISSLDCVHTFPLGSNLVHSAVLAPGGLAALSASHTGEVMVWDLERLREQPDACWGPEHFGHSEALRGIALVGAAVCTIANDRMLRVARCPSKAAAPRTGGMNFWSGSFSDGAAGGMPDADSGETRPERVPGSPGITDVEDVLRGVEDASAELTSSDLPSPLAPMQQPHPDELTHE